MVCKSTSLRYLQSYQLYRANSLPAKRWSETCFEPGKMFFGSLGKRNHFHQNSQPLNGGSGWVQTETTVIGHIGHVAGYHTHGICRKIHFLFRNLCEKNIKTHVYMCQFVIGRLSCLQIGDEYDLIASKEIGIPSSWLLTPIDCFWGGELHILYKLHINYQPYGWSTYPPQLTPPRNKALWLIVGFP